MAPRKIIIDCDVGTDDAWALFLLIKNETVYNIQVIAITCTYGNASIEFVVRNVLMVLKALNRLDIPVYAGCHEPIIKNDDRELSFHGPDGLGGLDEYYIDVDTDLISKEHAVPALANMLLQSPDETFTIICIGPLTNVALAVKMYPAIKQKINCLYIMGGNHMAVGNITHSAEFNFYQDPESVDILLKIKTFPIYILPWEACLGLNMSLEWRLNLIKGSEVHESNHSLLKLLDPIEKTIYEKFNSKSWMPCDAFLVAALLDEKIISKLTNINPVIELAGNLTRGQMILQHLLKNESNINLIEQINAEHFQEMIVETLKRF